MGAASAGSVRSLRRVVEIPRPAEEVFRDLDDIRITGAHMQKGEMGIKLRVEQISKNAVGEGATYHWWGKAYGLSVDYTAVVEKWVQNREKVSRTVGQPRLIVMSGFRMRWALERIDPGTRVAIDFEYEPPRSILGRILSRLLGKRYGDWCLDMITTDTVKALMAASPSLRRAASGA